MAVRSSGRWYLGLSSRYEEKQKATKKRSEKGTAVLLVPETEGLCVSHSGNPHTAPLSLAKEKTTER
jgi:hypothetical protein